MTLDQQTALSAANAAWSARNAAWWTYGATAAAAVANIAVLVYVARMPLREAAKSRNRQRAAAAMTLSHALAILWSIVPTLSNLDQAQPLPADQVKGKLEAVRRAMLGLPDDLDDSALVYVRLNTSTVVETMWSRAVDLEATVAPTSLFLRQIGPLEKSIHHLLEQVEAVQKDMNGK